VEEVGRTSGRLRVLTRVLAGLMALLVVPFSALPLFGGAKDRFLWTALGWGLCMGAYAALGWEPKNIRDSRVMGWMLVGSYGLGVVMLFPELFGAVGKGWGTTWQFLAAGVAALLWPLSMAVMILLDLIRGLGQ